MRRSPSRFPLVMLFSDADSNGRHMSFRYCIQSVQQKQITTFIFGSSTASPKHLKPPPPRVNIRAGRSVRLSQSLQRVHKDTEMQ